ncbi:P-loop containing nucleoside triphosphate hydrolase protein [Dichotomocladium elegans]|nr:P-loop containing nucleoside triphosphate hydrolase protein [Dichotomocladium elegans]
MKESLQSKNPVDAGKTIAASSILQREGELLRHALILFNDFEKKKKAEQKEKIEKYRAELPITPFANAIIYTLAKHRVLLVAGDTGCGKSTQVPQILMRAGYNKIACTQPRRIACSSLARRVSYETQNEFGSEIAYQVRFEGTKTKRTRILFLTEGLLLRQYAADPMLSMYDVIIVDEVHERHMMGDFLLALLKKLLNTRQDLCVVLMSATINAELFAQYFDAPTLNVPGRMYPVKTHFWPNTDEDTNLVNDAAHRRRQSATVKESIPSKVKVLDSSPYLKVMEYIDQTFPITERGDLLIFMSGINEIEALAERLKEYAAHSRKWVILMLHSTLAVDEQEKVFDMPPEGVRKCIISTNIAETSLTIDGIRFVIDSGKVKELSHDATSNMSKLSEFWVSQASAKQRAGRSGRTGPGECFRLYSENEFNHFNEFPVPEIQRAPLEPLILQIKGLELGNPRTFDFIEPPHPDALNASIEFLKNLGALDNDENITGLGSVLSNLPVDAVIGKMLLMATVFNLVDPVITIAASLSVQSPFIRLSPDTNSDILRNRRVLDSQHGDPITLLNLWQQWLEAKADRRTSSRKWCARHGVGEHRLYEIAKMKRQFEKVLNDFQPGLLQYLADDRDVEDQKAYQSKRDMIKREKYEQRSSKRRRMLNVEYEGQEDWQSKNLSFAGNDRGCLTSCSAYLVENDNSTADIRDLEFSIANNLKDLRERAAALSERDISLIKLIVCSAFYPQLAIGDEHNPYRNSNEIVFHTPVKNFISIHPTSVIAAHPDWVQGLGENVRKDDLAVEQALHHQLLCYLHLLETNKPYLLGITRVPGIHTLLLLAKTIDTNADCSVLVFDSYYMAQFRTSQVAEYVLYQSHKLRMIWQRLLNQRINRGLGEMDQNRQETIFTPNSVESMPKAIRQILEEHKRLNDEDTNTDMWTPAVEADFQTEVRQLAEQLTEALETAISAEFRVAKASELIKMVFIHSIIFESIVRLLNGIQYPKYKAPINEDNGIPRSWNPKEGKK